MASDTTSNNMAPSKEELIKNIGTVGWYPPKCESKELPSELLELAKDPDVQDAVVKRWRLSLNRRKLVTNQKWNAYRINIRREKEGIKIMVGVPESFGTSYIDNLVPLNAILRGSAWLDTEHNEKNNILEPPLSPDEGDEDDHDCCGNHEG